jgi:hypothetical protein
MLVPWLILLVIYLLFNSLMSTIFNYIVPTLPLGSRPRQGFARLWAKKEAKSHTTYSWECERVWGNEPSHPQGVPLWELESRWTPESSEDNCKGQTSIGKLLKFRCLKWARIAHLDIWNTSYGQKKGRKSNWQFDSGPLKVGKWPNFPAWRWRATYRWKAFDKGYNFALDLISIRGLHVKLWHPKVAGVPTLVISGLPFGGLETKNHLDVGHVGSHRVYYKREGGGFPKSGPWWVLWVRVACGLS